MEQQHVYAGIYIFLYTIMYMFSIGMNSFTLFISFTQKLTSTQIILINMFISNLLLTLIIPGKLYNLAIAQPWERLINPVFYIAMYSNISFLAYFCFDRYWAIRDPINYMCGFHAEITKRVCTIIWCVLILRATISLILFRKSICYEIWCFTSLEHFSVCTVIIVFSYHKLLGLIIPANKNIVLQTRKLIILYALIFMVCFLPYHMLVILKFIYSSSMLGDMIPNYREFHHSTMLVMNLSVGLTPLIYFFTYPFSFDKVDV